MISKNKFLGSLLLAISLTGGQALASSIEPVPDQELEEVPLTDSEAQPVTVDLAFRDAEPSKEQSMEEEFLPDLPVLLDGKLYSAEELEKAGIQLPHYVLDSNAAEQNILLGFRDAASLKVYLERTGQMPSSEPQAAAALPCWFRPPAYFFDGTYYTGRYFSVRPGFGYANLGIWDNRISSIRGTRCGRWTLLTELPYFQGRRLWLGASWAVPNLSSYRMYPYFWPFRQTWNNRASSVMVFW
ncbi:MAG TPA: hypothetical protein VFZ09_47905 [Archangium sp.]|uniref:hypothetical protein n=1 Tax=Archangium sp. TaxID=1872627 RepID=UPI002E36C7C5|nr:hypothetical protein [Archangium sp.]HEX5754001.1 hypothetical protein [Archangium sp.]